MFLNCSFINYVGEKILNFFNPELKYENRITSKWFLVNPTHFSIALFSYLIFAMISYLYKLHDTSKNKQIYPKKINKIKKVASSEKNANNFQNFLSRILPIYNLIQVFCSFYVTILTVHEAKRRNFSIVYNVFDVTQKNLAICTWLFYINKLCDFADTLLIVLRKKWNQFTFLHVYHHLSVFFIMWVNTNVGYDGDIYYVVTINSFVHFIMYLYYFISSMKYRVPLIIKASVTYAQMIQFFSIIFPGFCVLFLNFTCVYPRRLVALSFYYCISLLVLFINFTIQTYIFPKSKIE